MDLKKTRNFSIIAHIDHGKSTLADRILELTQTISERDLQAQHLDTMDLERERGITIKLNAVQIEYKDFLLHLIDTPGHVDFTYEVSRSLAACEGALLVVDAVQGIQAQTLANVYLAMENDLEIIVVINKIDLPAADPNRVKKEIEDVIGIPADDAILISAKTGLNVDRVLDAVVERIPPPKPTTSDKLQALIFDSYFDIYRGVILLVRIFSGELKIGDKMKMMSNSNEFEVVELGIRTPKEIQKEKLSPGEVGWIGASIRDAKLINVGDTITLANDPIEKPLPGYKKMKPVLFAGIYPVDTTNYTLLKDAMEKISLSDSSIAYEPESSEALGFGFRCGFLGLLHMEIIKERLDREFNIPLIVTTPSVEFIVHLTNGNKEVVSNPATMPKPQVVESVEEPFIKSTITLPKDYIGSIMTLCQNKRGVYINLEYVSDTLAKLTYELPLVEIILDFFDRLKSLTKGYATFDYEMIGYRESKLIKLDILLNHQKIDALSIIVHREFAYKRGASLTRKLKEVIPRQAFEVPIQAAINNKIIARETIKAYRKDVTAKLYGGDVTRRKKLLEKQKKGKKRMKQFGRVNVPQEAFLAILKVED